MADEPKQEIIRLCIDNGCIHIKNNHTNFYKVPDDGEMRRKWLYAVGREDLINENKVSYEICSDHFKPQTVEQIKRDVEETMMRIPLFDDLDPNSFVLEDKLTLAYDPVSVSPIPDLTKKTECRIHIESDEDADTMEAHLMETQTKNKPKATQSVVNFGSGQILKKMNLKVSKGKENQSKIKSREIELKKIKKNVLPKQKRASNNEKASKTLQNNVYLEETDDKFTKKICDLLQWKNEMKAKYKNKRNTTEFKLFALNLYISSTHLYKHLIEVLMLPSVNDLKQLKPLQYAPSKLNYQTLNCLANKLKSLPDNAKYCSLIIDTMDLKQHLYYNITRDEIIGLHNFNGNVTNVVASVVYFAMVRGISYDWKQLVSYTFLANQSCFAELDSWINYIIEELSTLGFKLLVITSSQEMNFIGYAAYKVVTVEKPYFIVKGEKIYYVFDVPHWLTCLRNDLMDNSFYHNNQIISWQHINKLYTFKTQTFLSFLPKITKAHVSPSSSERGEVKYAAQIFSQSVFSIFDMLINVNIVPKDAKPTSDFIKTINDIFDVLNSKEEKCDNEYKCAFTASENQLQILMKAQKMFQNLYANHKETNVETTKEIYTFRSIQITIHSLILLSSRLKELGIRLILTSRLNKEPLDGFKKLVIKKGLKSKVTPLKFVKRFAKQFVKQILPNSKSEGKDIFELLETGNIIRGNTWTGKQPMKSEITPVLLGEACDYRFQLPQKKTFTYVVSYLLFKCSEKHKCPDFDKMQDNCRYFKLKEDINISYSFSGYLKIPPATFYNNVRKLDDVFVRNFSIFVISKPAIRMLECMRKLFDPPCKCFPTEYLLKLFIRFKIYSTLINNKSYRRPSQCQNVEAYALLD